MKRIKRYIIAIACAVSLLCLTLGLVACQKGAKISDLRVENARVNFMRGDEFDTGENFAVIAEFADGTEKDVTAEVTIRQENGMDMNVPGDYQITVSYQNKRAVYTIYVNDAEDVLRKIELDTSAVKKSYELGDAVSLDGLVLHLTYENSQGVSVPVETASLKNFAVEIKNEAGVTVRDVFTALGKFTVTVSQGAVKASFDVSVDGINISTVQGAIAVGGFYKSKVCSGETFVQAEIAKNGLVETAHYVYDYGDNYTRFTEMHDDPNNTYHCSADEEGIFITRLEGDKIVVNNMNNPDIINGSPYLLWYMKDTVYGIENTLTNLYAHAKACSNGDLAETADAEKREYSFQFTGLELRGNSYDYFETQVSFTLGEDYNIASVKYRQDYYENNTAWKVDEPDAWTFITDPVTGKTRPQADRPSQYTIVTVAQETGERTATNEYTRDMFKVNSFDLKYNGQTLEDGAVLDCDVAAGEYLLTIENVLPATASFAQDALRFDYEGNRGGADSWISNEHFTVTNTSAGIRINVKHGGTWTLIFKTEKVTKRLTLNVTGEAPETMRGKIRNDASKSFYEADGKRLPLNGAVYFYGEVDSYADAAQSATLVSGDTQAVTLERTTIGGVDCFQFSATVAGTYEVRVASDAKPSLGTTFTFTVSDAVDFSEILTGSYTATDSVGNIYVVAFTRADEGATVKGTLLVTRTPTEEDGTPITDETVSETLSFYVEDLEITVEHGMGDKIWIELGVNEENELVLVDQHNLRFVLTRTAP